MQGQVSEKSERKEETKRGEVNVTLSMQAGKRMLSDIEKRN